MRIVERLGTVGSALQSEVAAGSQYLKGTNRATSTEQLIYQETRSIQGINTNIKSEDYKISAKEDTESNKERGTEGRDSTSPVLAFQWLDDAQLGVLTTAELEDVMDRYLISVVQQLVQVLYFDTASYRTKLFQTEAHCMARYCSALHYTTLHYTTLHYTTQHYFQLQFHSTLLY